MSDVRKVKWDCGGEHGPEGLAWVWETEAPIVYEGSVTDGDPPEYEDTRLFEAPMPLARQLVEMHNALIDADAKLTELAAELPKGASVVLSVDEHATLKNDAASAWSNVERFRDDLKRAATAIEELTKQRNALLREREAPQRKLDDLAERYKGLETALEEARGQLRAVKAAPGDVWRWQGDGGNHPETMSAALPVVMTAETVRVFIGVRIALEERGCEKGREISACLDSRNPCPTCSALGACPV